MHALAMDSNCEAFCLAASPTSHKAYRCDTANRAHLQQFIQYHNMWMLKHASFAAHEIKGGAASFPKAKSNSGQFQSYVTIVCLKINEHIFLTLIIFFIL